MKRFHIWYCSNRELRAKPEFGKSHHLVATVYAQTMEKAFDIMNGADGDHPNPLETANAQEYLRESPVSHTCMMVGDLVEDSETGSKYMVAPLGWQELS